MALSFIQDENAVEKIDGMTYEFPYTMHERDLGNFTVPWHWHEELEFDYAYKGTIIIETVHKIYRVNKGEAYFINTNVMNTKRKAEGALEAVEHAHLFHPIILTGHYKSIYETKYLNPVLKNRSIEVVIIKGDTKDGKDFLDILHALTEISKMGNMEFKIRNLLSEAWICFSREVESQRQKRLFTPSHIHERTKKILSFIHRNYSEKISIADMAAYAGVSTKECIRSFKNTFHQTPMDYLIGYRIEQAKGLLKETDKSITDIAFITGFNNSAYFSKVFKKYLAMTPMEFRQLQKK